jgi:hypothetical protein
LVDYLQQPVIVINMTTTNGNGHTTGKGTRVDVRVAFRLEPCDSVADAVVEANKFAELRRCMSHTILFIMIMIPSTSASIATNDINHLYSSRWPTSNGLFWNSGNYHPLINDSDVLCVVLII